MELVYKNKTLTWLIEKVVIAISSPPFLVIRSLLFSVPFASTLGAAIFVVGIALVVPSPSSFRFGGIRGFPQTEIGFPSRSFLSSPQDIGD